LAKTSPITSEHQRRGDEPAERLGADAADGLRVANIGQPRHQGGEDQRRDDHLDQAQEDVGDDAEVTGDVPGRFRSRRGLVADIADEDAEDQRGKDQQ
jgi:hypothetical protein